MFANMIDALSRATLGDLIDIIFVTMIIYSFFRLIKDTKAYQMALGLAIVGVLYLVSQWGQLYVTNWLIATFINYLIIAIIILFAPELSVF